MESVSATNLIVNYLPQDFSERDLYAMFITIGPIDSCKLMKDYKTGYSYGFAFVNFKYSEDAQKAIDRINGLEIYGKRLKVSYARPSGDHIKGTNLYITGLPRNFTDDDLENVFGPYGKIIMKTLLKDRSTGKPRGVGFVRYDTREEAQLAIKELDGKKLGEFAQPLSVKVAEDHGKLKSAYMAGMKAAKKWVLTNPQFPNHIGQDGSNFRKRPMKGLNPVPDLANFNPAPPPRMSLFQVHPFNTNPRPNSFVQYPLRGRPNMNRMPNMV